MSGTVGKRPIKKKVGANQLTRQQRNAIMKKRDQPFDSLITPKNTPDKPRRVVHRTIGRRTGLGVCSFMFNLMELNEMLPKNKKMTNEELKRQLFDEFPTHLSQLQRSFDQGNSSVNYYRTLYNEGRLIRSREPKNCAFRYNINGDKVDARSGKKLLSLKEQNDWRRKYGYKPEGSDDAPKKKKRKRVKK